MANLEKDRTSGPAFATAGNNTARQIGSANQLKPAATASPMAGHLTCFCIRSYDVTRAAAGAGDTCGAAWPGCAVTVSTALFTSLAVW